MNSTYTIFKCRVMKKIVIILSILLLAAAGLLAASCIYINTLDNSLLSYGSDTVSDNMILNKDGSDSFGGSQTGGLLQLKTSVPMNSMAVSVPPAGFISSGIFMAEAAETGDALELYRGNPEANTRFQVDNMLPGDMAAKDYSVKVYHDGDITLYFQEEITEQLKNLGQVLHIKVTDTDTGEVVCDTFFSEADGFDYAKTLKANSQGYSIVNYKIEASVDTSVGNEYQGAQLTADFKWHVNEEDQGNLTPPIQTGQKPVTPLLIVLGVALVVLVASILIKRRKEDKKNG